jgi:PIN domain nuclease of toxin-antitoxin system
VTAILLDTHVLLWWLDRPSRVRAEAASAIRDPGNRVLVSAATAWEIAIKRALGKLRAPDDLETALQQARFDQIPINVGHALAAGGLPKHHADPFDRMLVAQAKTEGLTIATRDPAFLPYGVALLRA